MGKEIISRVNERVNVERKVDMRIGGKEYSEIVITDKEDNLLVSITDQDIIEEKNCKVICVPVECKEKK